MRRSQLGLGLALVVLLILGWAWWDGGREPLRPIEQEIPVPENVR